MPWRQKRIAEANSGMTTTNSKYLKSNFLFFHVLGSDTNNLELTHVRATKEVGPLWDDVISRIFAAGCRLRGSRFADVYSDYHRCRLTGLFLTRDRGTPGNQTLFATNFFPPRNFKAPNYIHHETYRSL